MRFRQFCTGVGALVVLIGLVVGAPIALFALAGNPLPDHVPALSEVTDALTSPDDGQLFLRVLAVVGWLGWATFALSVLVEIPARVLRLPAPRLPGMRRQQRAAATLVGSVALIIAASPAVASAAEMSAPYPATAPAVMAAPMPVAAIVEEPVERPVYRVEKGDYLGHIADRYLGDFDRYPELAKLNKIRDPDVIRPGQKLHLPATARDEGIRSHATGLVATPPSTRTHAEPPPAPRPEAPPVVEQEPEVPPLPPARVVERGEGGDTGGVGASARPGQRERLNVPLAVSAVLAAASLVGAQIGVLLGLRDRRRATTPRRPRNR
ncbi:LysM peptidoglycan-binding domain-containing protein [Phytohabitans aurantiacus]|uniref:LysM domain-containing protein n=1 Tax=Phytohabitans aurantiacus TaxID=3016789 RepID=A0ABQ5QL01_9ACTN|nr:LysM domain-containing protein [Phytohabitans aurantiacus]GLH94944.1 hypothetical protein Pa4123_02160 [Phytohabitans aurantiacus]